MLAPATERRLIFDRSLTTSRAARPTLGPHLLEITMGHAQIQQLPSDRYELRFCSLFRPGRGYTFPCDAGGRVDIDALSDGERQSYLYARAIIGRELSFPAVQRSDR